MMTINPHAIRAQFPALELTFEGKPAVYFDGPAGTQVPHRVIDAIGGYLANSNANHGGYFATSRQSDEMLLEARRSAADFFGAADDECIVFGPNMTSITFQISRALARTWKPGDEIILSQSDHDANVTPWVRAAQEAGAKVRWIPIRPDGTLDIESLPSLLSDRTMLVAVGCASNATGTIHPFERIVSLTHEAGALVYLDAVHYAPHRALDVDAWGADFVVASAYKFFGPHVGILLGKRALLESLPAYKVRPAADCVPDRWMTGTPNLEGIAGVKACLEYWESLGRSLDSSVDSRRSAYLAAAKAIQEYETKLSEHFLRGLMQRDWLTLIGHADPRQVNERAPTFALRSGREFPHEMARRLARQGIFVWHGNFYALPLTESLGLEPEGLVRIGFVHYNTMAEVDHLLAVL